MDEIQDVPPETLSARIPMLTVVLTVFMAVATAVMVKPAISESADQRAIAVRAAARVPAQPAVGGAPQAGGSVRPMSGPAVRG